MAQMPGLQEYQTALADLLQEGRFKYSTDLATISAAEYDTLINSIEPENYELAWQHENGLNILEKCTVERGESGLIDALVYESSWVELGLRVFEFKITTVPRTIVVGESEPEHSTSLTMTYWVLNTGSLAHYRAMIDDTVIVSTGILNGKTK